MSRKRSVAEGGTTVAMDAQLPAGGTDHFREVKIVNRETGGGSATG